MSFLSDLHMHTVFSDGLSVSEDYIQEAVKRGFLSIGFSEHSFTAFDLSFCMSEERREVYLKKLPLLKEQYKGKIEIYRLCYRRVPLYRCGRREKSRRP